MNVILRNFENPFDQKVIECNNLSISYDQDGAFIEADNYEQLFADLVASGYKCKLNGRILNIEAKSIFCF